ncbi:MAG TPA: NAD(P)-dependent oxidoreductase [Rhodocyclaceae bacterium]|nr:NAD(P)-dependent oxidoreductase [Rhodocyclaceae bacterium]
MKLLLTGGTGFFGKALLRHWCGLAEHGMATPSVTVLSRSPQVFLERHPEFAGHAWLRFHRGDILDPQTLPRDSGYTHLLHAATDSTLGPNLTSLQRYTQIADGTRHMLDYAVSRGIRRFLLTSSGGAYGPQPPEMEQIPESYNGMPDPLDAQHAYSVAKRCAEHLCALYQSQHDLEPVIARCFAFAGPDLPQDVHFAIGNFVRDALGAPEILVNGDGMPIRSYMDQRDLAHWLYALLSRGRAGQAYNVGSDAAISIRELAYLVRDLVAPGKDVRIAATPDPAAQSFRNRYVPSIAKARAELELTLSYTLDDAIRTMAGLSDAAR